MLSNRDIERILYPLLGDGKTLTDVEAARAALEKTYHDLGYATVFVDIPEQDVGESVVRLRVTEGRLRQVGISGARYFSERKILAALPAATAGTVPSVPALQQQLSTVNSLSADQSVIPILKAGPTPGTVDLALKVDDHLPLHGSLEVNNQYSPGTKPLRAIASLSYSNLFNEFDNLSAQFQDSPQLTSGVSVFAANYAMGPAIAGFHPSAYYIHSDSNVATVGTLGVLGKGDIIGTRFAYPISATSAGLQAVTLGVDYKHFKDMVGLPNSPGLVTPISYFNLSVALAGNLIGNAWQNSLSGSANFGPRYGPHNEQEFANKRFTGRSNYFYVRLDDALTFRLPVGFQIEIKADGQFAAEPLISNEEYSIAGADGVRGYLEAEALGDNAVKGSFQLESPALTWHAVSLLNGFVFYDMGRADIINSLQSEPAHTTLRSFGAGIKLVPGRYYSGSLTWAEPLADGPQTHRRDSRVLFDMRAAF